MTFFPRLAPANIRTFKSGSHILRFAPATRASRMKSTTNSGSQLSQKPSAPPTFREVIVPLDGSRYAEHALPWAIQIAKCAGARVRLVHIHQKMQPAFHSRGLELYQNSDRLLREPMEEYLADISRRIIRTRTVSVAPTVVDGRHVTTDLSRLAASTNNIIVMATRGRSLIGRTIVGSGLDAVLQRRQAPILHVRGYKSPVDLAARSSLRHGLVPLDGTLESEQVLWPVASLSKLTDGRQTLLRVLQSAGEFSCHDGSLYEGASELKDKPGDWLDDTARIWRRELPHMRTSVVWTDISAAREILIQAEEREADFIAIATRDRGQLSRLLRPGVFDHLIRRSRIPVLVVKQLPAYVAN